MNKAFSRKFVEQEARKLGPDAAELLTYGDILHVADLVARDQLRLKDVSYELKWMLDCEHNLYPEMAYK